MTNCKAGTADPLTLAKGTKSIFFLSYVWNKVDLVHCKNMRRFYGKMPGIWQPVKGYVNRQHLKIPL